MTIIGNKIYTNIVEGCVTGCDDYSEFKGHVITKDGVVSFYSLGTFDESLNYTKLTTSSKGRHYEQIFIGEYITKDKTLSIRANKFINEVLKG